jgi:cellulose synthase/poly-beta-1,6-N-acetylglucosamine synthase-like glycosyltransferase
LDPRVTVLIPTRGRPQMLRRSIRSLCDLAYEPDRVQIYAAVDPDDQPTLATLAGLPEVSWVYIAPERWGYRQLYRYYNVLAGHATGRWVLLWNDDAEMTQNGWDAALDRLPKHVIVGDYPNNLSPEFVCFPAVRRDVVEVAGSYCPFETPHIDSVWQDIGRQLGRVYPVYGAYVHHDRPDLTRRPPDATYLEGRQGLDHAGYFSPVFQDRLAELAGKIRAALPPHPDEA